MKRATRSIILLVLLLQTSIGACRSPERQPPVKTEPITPTTVSVSTPIPTSKPKPGGEVIISYGVGTPRHFNPALLSGSSTAVVGTQIFASPLRYDQNWNPQQ